MTISTKEAAAIADKIGVLRAGMRESEAQVKALGESLTEYMGKKGLLLVEGKLYRVQRVKGQSVSWNGPGIEVLAAKNGVDIGLLRSENRYFYLRSDHL